MQLVYLAPVNWNSIAQRPHFFVEQALKQGFSKVLWINPSPARLPKVSDVYRLFKPVSVTSIDLPLGIQITGVKLLPLEPFPKILKLVNGKQLDRMVQQAVSFSREEKTILVCGKPSLLASELIKLRSWKHIIYDSMDDFPEFFAGISKKSMENNENMLLEFSDLVLCSSSALLNKHRLKAKRVDLILNACSEKISFQLEQLPNINKQGFCLGYIGAIKDWFDWQSVKNLAFMYPEVSIRIIGACEVIPPASLPKNVTLEPAVPYDKVAELLRQFDVGLIPFKVNQLTGSVDPVKYYEYRAAGLPILSTRFGEMAIKTKKDNVYFIDEVLNCNLLDQIVTQRNSKSVVFWSQRFDRLFASLLSL